MGVLLIQDFSAFDLQMWIAGKSAIDMKNTLFDSFIAYILHICLEKVFLSRADEPQ